MAGIGSIRSTIHTLWESFFPSTIYFLLFAAVAVVLSDSLNVLNINSVDKGLITSFKQHQFYLELKELELHKLLPIAVFAIFTLSIYLFDRIVSVIAEIIPPFPRWNGGSTLYINRHQLRTLWLLLPHVKNPAALDFVAKTVIDRALIEGKSLPDNSKEHLATKFSKAARLLNYSKVGFIWSLIVMVYVVVSGNAEIKTFIWFIAIAVSFISLGALGVILETKILIAQTSEDVRIAEAILRAEGHTYEDNSESMKRIEEFDHELKNCIFYSTRFVNLAWKPQREWGALLNAFIGFRLTKGSKGNRR